MPPLVRPPLPPLGSVTRGGRTPDISTISGGEWHSATDGMFNCSGSAEVVPLGPDMRGGSGPGGRNSSTPALQEKSAPCGPLSNLATIAEVTSEVVDDLAQESLYLAALFSPEVRILLAASNGEWSSEEEGEESTVVETTPTAPAPLQPVPPHTRQSRVNLL